MGEPLLDNVKKKIGLKREQSVIIAIGIIDAHVGVIGCLSSIKNSLKITEKLCKISGTGNCHMMMLSKNPIFVKGVWGLFKDAMVPGYYLSEGGQSTCGSLIDHHLKCHPYYHEVLKSSIYRNNGL